MKSARVARWLPGMVALGAAALVLAALVPAWRRSSDLGHAWAVPVLMAFLWWERWHERPKIVPRRWPGGAWVAAAAIVVVALPLRLLLVPFPLWPALLAIYVLGFVIVAGVGAWGLAGWDSVRWVLSPCVLLLSALPVPSALESGLILPVREVLAQVVAELTNLLGRPAVASGTSIRLAGGWVGIDEACGGIRSLQACVMIGLFFGEWYRLGWLRRLSLLGLSVGFAIAGNFARIAYLAWRANEGADAVASAHEATGWIAMLASIVGTGWLAAAWMGYQLPSNSPPEGVGGGSGKFSPVWIWLGVITLGLAMNEGGARWWFHRGAAQREERVARWSVRWPERLPSFAEDPLPETARDLLRPDLYRAAHWKSPHGLWRAAYYVEWQRGQTARFVPFLHNPTVCLPLAGCTLVAELEPLALPMGGTEMRFQVYKFERAGGAMLVAFTLWDTARGGSLAKPTDVDSLTAWWEAQWREVREARQDQPAQLFTVACEWNEHAEQDLPLLLQEMVVRISPERFPR